MSKPVILVGGGGHAKVLLEALRCMSCNVLGYLSPIAMEEGCIDIGYLGKDDAISGYSPENVLLVNGVGSVKSQVKRVEIFDRFKQEGYTFATVIHPSAVVATDVQLGEGCQVMAGSVLQPGVCCEENVIINTRAGVDHDCHIGAHSHVSVGATLSGEVCIGCRSHIGAGSTVIQGISVGERCVVAAGAAVIDHVPDGTRVAGVPAKRLLT